MTDRRTPEKKRPEPGFRAAIVGYPSIIRHIRLTLPSGQALTDLDASLASRFGVSIPTGRRHSDRIPDLVAAHLTRLGAVMTTLLRAGGVPMFAEPVGLAARRDKEEPDVWAVLVAMPMIEQIPARLFGRALEAARQVIAFLLSDPHNKESCVPVWEALDQQILASLRLAACSSVLTLPLLEEAYRLGIPFRHLGHGFWQFGWAARSKLVHRSVVPRDSANGSLISGSKFVCASFLRQAGLPTPRHIAADSLETAVQAAAELGWPVVIKPDDRERGEGVTMHVDSKAKLDRAFTTASERGSKVLVEKQVAGTCHRMTVTGGRFLYAVRRDPPGVTGDGKRSIAELVDSVSRRNARLAPWMRGSEVPMDEETRQHLARQGMDESTVPDVGLRVYLRAFEAPRWGGDVNDITEQVHPENARLVEEAARLLGLDNAGVDLISLDVSIPWYANGAVINEVNFAPHIGSTAAARSRMQDFIERLVEGDGRIPIHVVTGGAVAREKAEHLQMRLVDVGVKCFLTSHESTLDDNRSYFHLDTVSLFARSRALLMNQRMEALVVLVQNDEFVDTGLPFDQIHSLDMSDIALAGRATPDGGADASGQPRTAQLRAILAHVMSRSGSQLRLA